MTIDELFSQLSGFFGGGGGGATSYAAPSSIPDFKAQSQNTTGMSVPQVGVGNTPNTPSDGSGLGLNLGTLSAGLTGMASLGNLLQGTKAMNLAKDQFNFQKGLANTNLNNSIKTYNNSLEDRLRARGAMQGDDASVTEAEIDRKRLSR